MTASYKQMPYNAWYERWPQYLLEIAAQHDERLNDIELLLVKAVKCAPQIVQQVIESINPQLPISTKLSALWAVRKSGIKLDNFPLIMQSFKHPLMLSILSNSDDTRIMALRLLAESHKTSELLSELECEHLLMYLEYNANTQSPATRQKQLALLNKAFNRLELNLIKVVKDYEKNPSNCKLYFQYVTFLKDVMIVLNRCLFAGANFSRRSVSLILLSKCIPLCLWIFNLDKKNNILPENLISPLVNMLSDSYESNKEIAVNILKEIEDKMDCSLIEQYKLAINLQEIRMHLSSVRPTDSVTAAYQLEFYCNRALAGSFENVQVEPVDYMPTQFAALKWLMHDLQLGLQLAKTSLLQAAKLQPLYGLLFAIKHLLKKLDFQSMALQQKWKDFIAELIAMCKELTKVVGPIVNSSSPEGHLPNDFGQFPPEIANNETELDAKNLECRILSNKLQPKYDAANIKTTPQMVLLCAWRTVKEASLILGDIVLRAPIHLTKSESEKPHYLITKDQIYDIGDLFKHLLAETKHRGAFEQAYVGFSKLCCRLWRVESPDLNGLPLQWLRDLLAIIAHSGLDDSNEQESKICATRRSAGVPFMVQALITSELQVGSTKSLLYCMSSLLHMCEPNNGKTAETRTHALNILRALFRCTDLNEAVGEFVADGLKCAIRSYDADTWSEKNSATLLFAALITRIFGVQRTKDSENLNIRNKMTGRIFFLRYPKLYDFFLQQLQEASALIMNKQKAHKLHPLLLILSRLYPSALEGTESNLKVRILKLYCCIY